MGPVLNRFNPGNKYAVIKIFNYVSQVLPKQERVVHFFLFHFLTYRNIFTAFNTEVTDCI